MPTASSRSGGIMGGYDTRVTDERRATSSSKPRTSHRRRSSAAAASSACIPTPAHRFERGVDPELPRQAVEIATRLIVEIAGGAPGPVTEAVLTEHLPAPASVPLRRARLARVLGVRIADAEVERILRALGLAVEAVDEGWRVTAPTRRFDLAIEEDLIEEIARIHGYDAIPATLPGSATRVAAPGETAVEESTIRRQLAARDYLEAINYAFVDAALLEQWSADGWRGAAGQSAQRRTGVMRTQLLPGLVAALARNVARQQPRVRLFELGKVFAANGAESPLETQRIAAAACGDALPPSNGAMPRARSTSTISRATWRAWPRFPARSWSSSASKIAWGHPGRSADVHRVDGGGNRARIGWIGELHPRLQRALDLDHRRDRIRGRSRAIAGQGAAERARACRASRPSAATSRSSSPTASPGPSFRPLSERLQGPLLRDLRLFDRYVGKGVETGFKSLAMGLILQDDSRTLTDRDVDAVVAAVVAALRAGPRRGDSSVMAARLTFRGSGWH